MDKGVTTTAQLAEQSFMGAKFSTVNSSGDADAGSHDKDAIEWSPELVEQQIIVATMLLLVDADNNDDGNSKEKEEVEEEEEEEDALDNLASCPTKALKQHCADKSVAGAATTKEKQQHLDNLAMPDLIKALKLSHMVKAGTVTATREQQHNCATALPFCNHHGKDEDGGDKVNEKSDKDSGRDKGHMVKMPTKLAGQQRVVASLLSPLPGRGQAATNSGSTHDNGVIKAAPPVVKNKEDEDLDLDLLESYPINKLKWYCLNKSISVMVLTTGVEEKANYVQAIITYNNNEAGNSGNDNNNNNDDDDNDEKEEEEELHFDDLVCFLTKALKQYCMDKSATSVGTKEKQHWTQSKC